MDLSKLDFLFDWIAAHPALAGLGVFLLCFGEALALVGFFLPGTALMFATGALVGTGDLAFWPTYGWCVAGAIAGDGVSFWIGRRFHERLYTVWPFSRYPYLIPRAAAFLDRHGGKSVLFARFIGPLRPVLPAVAGMLDMPVRRFVPANIISAALWAPVYLVPGAIVGASLDLMAEVTTRLAVLIVVVAALGMMLVWLVRALFNWLHPHAHALLGRGLAWARLHPVAGQIPNSLLDPDHREAKGLTVMAFILIGAAIAFLLLLRGVEAGGTVVGVDDYVFNALQEIRTPWMDHFMAIMTGFGDWQVLLPLFAAILLWLGWQQRWKAAAYWTAAALFALVLTQLLKISVGILRPQATYDGFSAFSFPSGHAVLATVVYGFLAVLIARELQARYRVAAYATAALLVVTIAFSRLYLGAHWLSDVLAGLSLGVMWVALLGIAYRSHPAATLPLRGLFFASGVAVAFAAVLHLPDALSEAQTRYAPPPPVQLKLDAKGWWEKDWQQLPAFRADLRASRRQPLNLQYAGDLDTLTTALMQQGWKKTAELNGASWLQWFGFRHQIMQMPVLPQVHEGRHESLLLVRIAVGKSDRMWALRLWQSGATLSDGTPVWVGSVAQMGLYSPVPGFAAPRGAGQFDKARNRLNRDLGNLPRRTAERKNEVFAREVLLVRVASESRTLKQNQNQKR